MSTNRWSVTLDGKGHEIVLRHGYWTARRAISVDGKAVLDLSPGIFQALRYWNTATDHGFRITGHDCFVRIDPTVDNMTYKKTLVVDGRDVASGEAVAGLPETSSGVRQGTWLAGYGGFIAQPFALAAIVIGQVSNQTHRQPLWLAAGFVGAAVCWGAARIVGDNLSKKVLLYCAVVLALLLLAR